MGVDPRSRSLCLSAMAGVEVTCLHAALCGSQLPFAGFLAIPLGLALVGMLVNPKLGEQILGPVPSFDLTSVSGWTSALSALQASAMAGTGKPSGADGTYYPAAPKPSNGDSPNGDNGWEEIDDEI